MLKVPLSQYRPNLLFWLWLHFKPWRRCFQELSPASKMISWKNWTRELPSVVSFLARNHSKIPPDLWTDGFFSIFFYAPLPHLAAGAPQVKFSVFSAPVYTLPSRCSDFPLKNAYGSLEGENRLDRLHCVLQNLFFSVFTLQRPTRVFKGENRCRHLTRYSSEWKHPKNDLGVVMAPNAKDFRKIYFY